MSSLLDSDKATDTVAKKDDNKRVKKRKNRNQWPFIIIFIIGLLILSYPLVSRFYYRVESNTQIVDFEAEKKKLTAEEVNKRMVLARAYNRSLNNVITADPYIRKQLDAGKKEYARMLEVHEKMGHIEIPTIDVNVPIYAGTSEEVLQKGAGHLEGTSLPVGGGSTHTVITAHTGLPTAELFTNLIKVKYGDKFYIHNLSSVLAYQVDQIKKVEPSNFNDLLIEPGKDYATLLTCTPIMVNSHRLLVRGHRVPYNPNEYDSLKKKNKLIFWGKVLGFILLLALIIRWIYRKVKKKSKEEV